MLRQRVAVVTDVLGGADLRMRIGYDDVDRLISYPDAHNLSVNVLNEVFGGVQTELRAGTRADLRVGNATRPARYG